MKLVRKNSVESPPGVASSRRGQRVSLWKALALGDVVSLTLHGFEHYRGTVDDRSEDGGIIWVIDRIGERRLFHIDDGFELFVAAQGDGVPNP
jgi:hypothetical protein